MSRGIFIAKNKKSVGRGRNQYDSTKPHLMVSLIKNPPHLDGLIMPGGTALTLAGIGSTEETLLTIKHNLPYTPELMIYFYVTSTEEYATGRFVFSGSSGGLADVIYADVDDTNVKIKHSLETWYFGGATSNAPDFTLRIKYYILSNDSHVGRYNTRGF